MVQVPVTTRRTAQVRPLGNERFRYSAPRNLVGPAMQDLGGAIGEHADALAELRQREAENAARMADVATAPAIAEAEAAFRSLRGVSASDEAFRDAQEKIQRLKTEGAKGLKDPLAQTLYSRVTDERASLSLGRMRVHRTEQVRVSQIETSEARVKTEAGLAVDASSDPNAFPRHLQTIEDESRSLASAAGWSEDARRQFVAEQVSGVHVSVVDKLRLDDPEAAEAWIDQHKEAMLPRDETAARRAIMPALEEAELDDAMARVEQLAIGGMAADEAEPDSATEATAARSRTGELSRDPLRGHGRISTTPEDHVKRGRLAVDFAAPVGTPIWPPMSGKVIEKGYKPAGNGHYVRIRHPNGFVTTYLHMRGPSPLEEGEEVTASTVIGSVGSTGKSTGPHLDFSIRNADGQAVNPLTVKWDEPDLPALPQYRAERNDAERLYAAARQVATERNYSRREYDGLLQRIDAMVAREDRLEARAEQDAIEKAMDTVAAIEEGGGLLTRKDQIPNWSALPGSTRSQLLGMIERNTQPKPIQANGDRALELELMSVYEPQRFIGTDLRQFRHEVTADEFGSLAGKQAQMRTKGPQAPVAIDHGRIWSIINRYGPEVGLKPSSKDKDERAASHRVFEMVRNDLVRVTGGERQPTDDEVKAAFDRATMEVVVRGAGVFGIGNDTQRLFEVEPGSRVDVNVPQEVAQRIVASFHRQMGRDPSAEEIARVYIRHKGERGFW